MQDFSQEDLDSLIQEALSSEESKLVPKNGLKLGLGETNMLSHMYETFSKHIPNERLVSLFQEVRNDILVSKNNLSLKDLHTVTKNCKKCPNVLESSELPRWNSQDPDVLFIVDNPKIEKESADLFVTAMKSAGFQSSKVCLTYVTRCSLNRKPDNSEVINCSSYLHTEVQLLNPKLIVTLGLLPLSVLLNSDVQLKQYRGSISWIGYWPIFSTYSPIYCIKQGGQSVEQFTSDIQQAYDFCYNKVDNDEPKYKYS
jgi:uracil-DNA glycosylase family 4